MSQLNHDGKFRVLCWAARFTKATHLVEVGTFRGYTAMRAASVFDRVCTIELDPELAQQATATLRHLQNVHVFCGSGLDWLPEILENHVTDSLVYLDGHYSGEGTALGPDPEPAVKEIEAMLQYAGRIRAVIIDDVRCFGTVPGFPLKSELLCAAEKYVPLGFELRIEDDQLLLLKEAT